MSVPQITTSPASCNSDASPPEAGTLTKLGQSKSHETAQPANTLKAVDNSAQQSRAKFRLRKKANGEVHVEYSGAERVLIIAIVFGALVAVIWLWH